MGKKVVKSPGKLKAKFRLINTREKGRVVAFWQMPHALYHKSSQVFPAGASKVRGFGQKSRPSPPAAVINLMGKEIMRVSLAQETMLMLMADADDVL